MLWSQLAIRPSDIAEESNLVVRYRQTPFLHVPPAPHATPSAAGVFVQIPVAGAHASMVQGLLSLQFLALPTHSAYDNGLTGHAQIAGRRHRQIAAEANRRKQGAHKRGLIERGQKSNITYVGIQSENIFWISFF